MPKQIKDYMTEAPYTIGHDIDVKKAKEMMDKYSCRHLPVLDGGRLVGILSSRDIYLADKLSKESTTDVKVEDIMTEEPKVVQPHDDLLKVAMTMHKEKIGSVIVSATEKSPWGIFTSTDALSALSEKNSDK